MRHTNKILCSYFLECQGHLYFCITPANNRLPGTQWALSKGEWSGGLKETQHEILICATVKGIECKCCSDRTSEGLSQSQT